MRLAGPACIALIFAGTAWGASTHDPPIRLTLEQSIDEAIRNSTLVLKSQNSEDLSAETLLQGYVEFAPNLTMSGNYNYTTGKTLVTTTLPTVADEKYVAAGYLISTTLNIFNGFSDWANLKASIERKHASELSLSWARQQVAIDITQSYLQVTLDQEIVAIAQKNLEASEALLKLLQGQAEVGAVTVADLYRQEAQTAVDRQFLVTSQAKLVDDQLIVIEKLRRDPAANYILEQPPLKPEPQPDVAKDEDSLIAEAFDAREDFHAEDDTLKATDWDITTQRSGYYPRLDLTFQRNAAGDYYHSLQVGEFNGLPPNQQGLGSQLGNQVQWTIGLYLSWNIFDRFVTRLNVEQAQITHENTQIDRDDLKILIAAEVRQVVNDYNEAQRNVQASEVGLIAAKKAYEVINGRYRVGASSFIDVLAAQAAYVQAASNEAQALIGLKLQERVVKYYLGKYKN
jgi:outer membrane protein